VAPQNGMKNCLEMVSRRYDGGLILN